MSSPSQDPSKKKKEKPANLVIPPPKPKLSKAERRALQEQQRAAKADPQAPRPQLTAATASPRSQLSSQDTNVSTATETASTTAGSIAQAAHHSSDPLFQQQHQQQQQTTVSLFSHLPSYRDPSTVFRQVGPTLQLSSRVTASDTTTSNLHPAVLQLGYEYATHRIRGGNARCRAMLHCFQIILQDFCPSNNANDNDIRTLLDHNLLKPAFSFWTHSCRPHSVSMGNAFTFLKHAVASLERTMEYPQMLEILLETLQAYERERIDYADVGIAEWVVPVLSKRPEVLLTFGQSEAVATVLLQLAKKQKEDGSSESVRVIIVDSRPHLSGKQLLHKLRRENMQCTYILLNALSYVIQDVTKILVGASALMSDGSILGPVGTGCVALTAHMHNIPFLVCCETYKISNKLYLESITHNELGNPNALTVERGEEKKGDDSPASSPSPTLKRLHLTYDLTPAAFVSGIVTELGIVPATSVAVLLREMNPQDSRKYDE